MKISNSQLPPDGKSGNWSIETFEVTKQESDLSRIRSIFRPLEAVEAGHYKRLVRSGEVIMSNTQMELRTNSAIMHRAKGHVLINGLGLGVVLAHILSKPEVESVTVIEKSEDVIKLTAPHFKDKRLTVIHADAYDYKPEPKKRFAAVWHDIWDDICSDNLASMTKLKRKYGRRTDWQGCWSEYECQRG